MDSEGSGKSLFSLLVLKQDRFKLNCHARDIGVRKHAVLRTAMPGWMKGRAFLPSCPRLSRASRLVMHSAS
jgi:hypothetical protein